MKATRQILGGLLLVGVMLVLAESASAQSMVTFSNMEATHIFGEELQFEADITTRTPINQLELIFKPNGGRSVVLPVSVSGENHLTADYEINSQSGIAPFSVITYWFSATLENGEVVESDRQSYTYTDNRYTWRSLDYGSNYHTFWIEGDTAFGQAVLDAAVNSLTRFEQYLNLPIPENISIYVYPSITSFQSALDISGTSWSAGHADPGKMRAFAAIPPSFDNALDIESKIPHEITHLRLYLQLGDNYQNFPNWLNEGIAILSERYPTTDWTELENAQNNDELYHFEELCSSFPSNGQSASLAYAQSESFIRYIFNQYGKIGLQALVDAYTQGHSCENGVLVGLGLSLETLEENWYESTFKHKQPNHGEVELVSWAILGALILITTFLLILFTPKMVSKEEIIQDNGE